jgi:hypothetical protein
MLAQLKDHLTLLMKAIKDGDGPGVIAAMGQVEAVLEANRAGLHPQLVHFLEQRSYAKALLFLGGAEDIPVGRCGGRVGKEAQ